MREMTGDLAGCRKPLPRASGAWRSLPIPFTGPQESPAGAKTSWGASRRRHPGPPWPRSATELGSFRGNFVVKLGSSAHCQACRHRHLEAARGKSGDRNERPPICLPQRWLACRKTVGLSLQAETREAPGDFSGWGSAGFRARQLTVVPLEHLGAGVSRASLTSDPPLKGSVASARWSVCWAPAGSFVPCHAGTGGLETCP